LKDGLLVRHALDIISSDLVHDYHSVHHFTQLVLTHFEKLGVIHSQSQVFLLSDNCAAQYKNKGNFADITHYKQRVQRIYFDAEHGKGELFLFYLPPPSPPPPLLLTI
jgi:hypothetical protein